MSRSEEYFAQHVSKEGEVRYLSKNHVYLAQDLPGMKQYWH